MRRKRDLVPLGLPSGPPRASQPLRVSQPSLYPSESAAGQAADDNRMGSYNGGGVYVGDTDYGIDLSAPPDDSGPSWLDRDGDGTINGMDSNPDDAGQGNAAGAPLGYIAEDGDDSDGSPYERGWNEDGTYLDVNDAGAPFIADFDTQLAALDPDSETYAQDAYGILTRAQWQDYVQRFQPIERELAEAIQDGPGKNVAEVRKNVNQAFDSQDGQFDRRLSRMGIEMSDEQRAARDRRLAISKAASMANEVNKHMDTVKDRRLGLLTGTSAATQTVKRPDEE